MLILPPIMPRPPEWLGRFFGKFRVDPEVMARFRAAHPENAARFDRLSASLLRGERELGCFVGAGVSQAYGFPTWYRFLANAAAALGAPPAAMEALEAGELEDAAQALEDHDPARFEEVIRRTFSHREIGRELKGAGAYLPFLPFRCVVTTNFDYVVDEIFKMCGCDLRPTVYGAAPGFAVAASRDGLLPLLKIHGDYLHERILTRAQYDRHYSAGSPLAREVAELFSTYSFLFVGFSLKDRNVARALADARKGAPRAHYAILPVEDPAELPRRDRELAELGVSALWYDGDHVTIEHLLGVLASYSRRDDALQRVAHGFLNDLPQLGARECERLLEERPLCHPYRLGFAWAQINVVESLDELRSPDRVDAVVARIDRAIGTVPEFGEAFVVRAMMNHMRFNLAAAADDLTRALGLLSPAEAPLLRGMRGVYRFLLHDLEGARTDLEFGGEHEVKADGQDLSAYFRFGALFIGLLQGREDAVRRLRDAFRAHDFASEQSRGQARTVQRLLAMVSPFWRFRFVRWMSTAGRLHRVPIRLMVAGFRSGLVSADRG